MPHMTTEFVRFPRTPHLAVLGGADVRGDKVLSPRESRRFLQQPVTIEEKVDGENLGLSVVRGELRAQARGSYVELGGASFQGLSSWLSPRERRISDALGEALVLFGEWCAVRHSVPYDALPDWFLVFDVYDKRCDGFWRLDKRDVFAEELGLATVPRIGTGMYALSELEQMLGRSRLGSARMEGVVARHVHRPHERAKLVREDFTEAIEVHWRSRLRIANRLRPNAS